MGLTDAEVGRRAGLSERRYGNYVRGAREPDLATVLRICSVLGVTPNELLLPNEDGAAPAHGGWLARLMAAAGQLPPADLRVAVLQVEVLLGRAPRGD